MNEECRAAFFISAQEQQTDLIGLSISVQTWRGLHLVTGVALALFKILFVEGEDGLFFDDLSIKPIS